MDSRSPPRRRGSPPMDNYRPRPAVDTYVPPTSHRYRRRSPSVRRSTSRLRSRSNGPSRRRREKAEESRFSRRPRSISSSPGRGHRSRYNRDERRRSPVHRNGRRRSYTPSDTSRSRSPRRYRRTRSSSRSPSRSSSVQSTRRRFVDMSSPLSKDNNEHNAPSSSSRHHGSKSDANGLKDSAPSPRPQSPDIYREMDRGRPKTYSRRHRSPSSSHSRSRDRARKRRRSLQRYEPVARRRRNTSSKSSSGELRRKRAHVSDDEDPRSHRR
jgi:serine/arginine repetitive matrix protein 1